MCGRQLFADHIRDNMGTYEFSVLDYVGYVFTMWYNGYFNYPFVVQASVIVLMLSCVSIVIIAIFGGRDYKLHVYRRNVYQKLYDHYYATFSDIARSGRKITNLELEGKLSFSEENISKRSRNEVMFQMCRLLVQVRAENFTSDKENFVRMCQVLGIHKFLERMLVFGSRSQRLRALQMAQFMMLDLPRSVLVRLLDSIVPAIRKEARMYYTWLSPSNPFRFFEEDGGHYDWRPWDALEIHFLLEARVQAHKEMPTLPPVVALCHDDDLRACLIREVGYWGNGKEVDEMKKYMDSKNLTICESVVECFAQARATWAEPWLMSVCPRQPEQIRISIMRALFRMKTGYAVPFFLRAWERTKVLNVKLSVLLALYHYNDEGRAEWERLRKEDTVPEEKMLFDQIEAAEEYSLILDVR